MPPCTLSSLAGMPGVHCLGSPGLAPVLARLASPVPGVWAAKEAIFSLCYPRNYLVSVLPWCSVHFCWKMLVCVSALRRNGDEGACPGGGRPCCGQRLSSVTSFCPLWEVLATGAWPEVLTPPSRGVQVSQTMSPPFVLGLRNSLVRGGTGPGKDSRLASGSTDTAL